MNKFVVALFALSAPLVLCYDEKYDKIDVDKILADEALFDGYIDCMLDKGPCNMENGPEFKKLLPEVIATGCSKCSPIQKQNIKKTVKAIQDRKPDKFTEFKSKYDPQGEYVKVFSEFILGSD